MKASELRIGNLIMEEVGIRNYNIIPVSIHLVTFRKVNHNIFKPIPLTEEWLLKFGFKNHLDTIWIHWSKESGLFQISTRLPQGSYGLWINGTMGCFEYVHQLQNLFFALTGEELTIKD